ncbi:MAG: tetratricopeptide repeat protein [Woeseia sp.]
MKRRKLSPSSFFSELRRRKVYQTAAAYAVVAWILLQIGEVTFEPLHLPGWAMTALVIAVILGFPVVLVISWFFDIGPRGIKRDAGAVHDPRESPSTTSTLASIAVLPFLDMSPERDQAHFCDGVAEEILNALARIEKLHVAARTSSFQFRDTSGDIREIGDSLGVATVLEGSVRKAGNRIRVTAQLISVDDGYHIWAKTFDEELKDIFAIQDEIARCIAESLVKTLSPKEQSAIRSRSSRDVLAYEYYLRGRQFFNRFRKRDIEFARQMFHQAIEIDPGYALAWAGYADCFSFLSMYVDPQEEYRTEACRASEKALELDPELAETRASRGLAYLICDQYAEANVEFEKALELNPRLYEAYYYYGRAKFHEGDLERAAELFAKAAEVDPAEYQSRLLRVQILKGLGRDEEALREAAAAVPIVEKHLEWNPDDARAMHLGAGSLIVTGDRKRAIRWLERSLEIDPTDSVILYNVACNLATLGEKDRAFAYLEKAIEHGTVSAAWMRNDTDLDNLRDDPRFETLLQQQARSIESPR